MDIVDYKHKLFGIFETLNLKTGKRTLQQYMLGVFRDKQIAERTLAGLASFTDSFEIGRNSKNEPIIFRKRSKNRPIHAIQEDGAETEERFVRGWITDVSIKIAYKTAEEREKENDDERSLTERYSEGRKSVERTGRAKRRYQGGAGRD